MVRNASGPTPSRSSGTASPGEVARFAAMAGEWWDVDGKFRPLHRMNASRVDFVRTRAAAHFGRDPGVDRPLGGLTCLDIGCGGGLMSEPLCRLGARVTGIDAAAESVRAASHHAQSQGLDIAYRHATPEVLVEEGLDFDLVLNMEVVEHAADSRAFLAAASRLVRPGGAMAASTINRTVKSFALAKLGAEYVLRWLPPGTHDWNRFVRPSELAAGLRPHGVEIVELRGLCYSVLADGWSLGEDMKVNYLAFAVRE